MEATVKALAVGRTETRAFADCQVTFAFESMMDELAQRLGIDPLALHRLNNHRLKPVGLTYGLKVQIRVALTTRLNRVPS